MKQLLISIISLLCCAQLYCQVDVGVTLLVDPTTSICGNSTQPITVTIFNYSASTINFTVNNVTVNVSITGASIQTFNSPVINTGSLASGASMNVLVTPTCNLSAVGVHTFNAATVNFSDVNAANNAMPFVDVTVTDVPTPANAGSDQVFCIPNGNLSGNVPTVGAGTWTLIGGAGVVSSPGSANSTITGLGVGPNTFRWTISNPPCPDSFDDVIITGEALPTITLTSAFGTDGQTVCENIGITPITYSIGGSATGATISGLPLGVSGSYFAGTFTINGTPTTPGIYNYTITTTGSTCSSITQNGTITVAPNATILLTSGLGSDNQTLCENTLLTPITYSIGGGGTGASVVGLPSGVSGSYLAGTFTISGTPTTTGVFNYTVTTTGTCVQIIANGTITVMPDATLSLSSAPGTDTQTICENTLITNIKYAIGGGGSGGTVSGLPAGLSVSFTAGTLTISGSPSVSGVFNYTVTTTGTCTQTSMAGTLTVNPNAVISLSSAVGTDNQSICQNTVITPITYTISGGGTGASVSGLPIGVNGSFAFGTFTISGTPTIAGVYSYTVTTSGTCAQVIANGTITVNGDATISLSSAIGTDAQTVCENTGITPITYSINGGGTGATVSGLPIGISGSFSAGTFTISGSTAALGVFNYTVTTTGMCVQSNINGSVTVNPNATINLMSAPGTDLQVTCINTAITTISYSIGGGGTGAVFAGLPSGVSGSYFAGNVTISGTPTIAGVYNYTVTTTGTCAQVSANGTITVDQDAQIVLSSALGTDAQNICENTAITTITYTISGGGTGGTVVGLPAGVTGSFAAGTFTISGTPTIAGVYNYTVTTTGVCNQTSTNGTITVVSGASATLTSGIGTDGQSVCENTAIIDITYAIGGSATGAFVSGLPAGVGGSFAAGVFTISGSPIVLGLFNYTITTTGGTCPAITVNGFINSTNQTLALVSQPFTNDQIICENTSISNIKYLTGGSATGANVIGLPTGLTTSYVGGVLTISGTPTETGTFFFTVSTTGPCTPTTAIGSIQINPIITGNTSGVNTTICENTSTTLTGGSVAGGNGNYTYFWESSPISGGVFTPALGINTAANYFLDEATNVLPVIYFKRTVVSGGCTDTALETMIVLDSMPRAIGTGSSTICAEEVATVSGITGGCGTVNWSTSGFGILTGGTTFNPTYISDLADEGTSVVLTLTVFSNNTCAPEQATTQFTIEVNPLPVAIAGGTSTICPNGDAVTVLGAIAANGNPSWSDDGMGTLIDSLSLFPTYTSSMLDAGDTVMLQLIVSSTASCIVPQFDTAYYSVIVSPIGNTFVDAGNDVTISAGNSVDLNAVGPAIINWNWSPSIGLSDATVPDPTASPTATTTYTLTGTDVNGCVAIDSLTISVDLDMNVIIANILTPNADTKNDTWIIENIEFYPNTEVMIVNREGQLVYESSNYDNSWGGTHNGKLLPDATYYYIIKFENSDKTYKGPVTILHN